MWQAFFEGNILTHAYAYAKNLYCLTLLDVGYYWQPVVKGGVIIAAVLLDCLRNQSEQT